jgi:sulfate transport system permease protein
MFAAASKRVLPGFTLSLGTSLLFVCLILLLPLSALVMQLAQMSWAVLGCRHQPAGGGGL